MNQKKIISRSEFLKKAALTVSGIGLWRNTNRVYGFSGTERNPEHRTLGRTGLKVAPIGMGATRTLNSNLMRAAYDQGMNFFDTGRSYSNGNNEIMLGNALKDVRDKVIIQSKLKIQHPERLTNRDTAKEVIKEMEDSVVESLKALQTDYVDIMLIHGMTDLNVMNHEVVLTFLQAIKDRGITRAIGFSSHANMAELIRSNNESKFYDTFMCAFNHKGAYVHSRNNRHHSWKQETLIRELHQAKANNIGCVAMKTTSGGPFPSESENGTFKAALKWVIQHDFVSTVAVAIASFQQLDENVQAMKS